MGAELVLRSRDHDLAPLLLPLNSPGHFSLQFSPCQLPTALPQRQKRGMDDFKALTSFYTKASYVFSKSTQAPSHLFSFSLIFTASSNLICTAFSQPTKLSLLSALDGRESSYPISFPSHSVLSTNTHRNASTHARTHTRAHTLTHTHTSTRTQAHMHSTALGENRALGRCLPGLLLS